MLPLPLAGGVGKRQKREGKGKDKKHPGLVDRVAKEGPGSPWCSAGLIRGEGSERVRSQTLELHLCGTEHSPSLPDLLSFLECHSRWLGDIQTMAVTRSGSLPTCQDIFLPTQDLGEVRYLLHGFFMFAAHVFYHTNYSYSKAGIIFFFYDYNSPPQYIALDF